MQKISQLGLKDTWIGQLKLNKPTSGNSFGIELETMTSTKAN